MAHKRGDDCKSPRIALFFNNFNLAIHPFCKQFNYKLKFNFKNAKVTNIVGLAKKYSRFNL